MKKELKHKSYLGSVNFDEENSIFYGKVLGIEDLVNYQGTSIENLEQSFKEAVEDYLEMCKKINKSL